MSTYTNEKWVSKTGAEFKYLSYIPEHCEGEKLPIVFFLHGAGERGDDVEAVATHGFFKYIKEGDCVYFVHSYYADKCDESIIAYAEYDKKITAAVEKDNIMGCQFHPEKSGETGLDILRAFCERG